MLKTDKKLQRIKRKRRSKIIIGNSERPRVVFSESNLYLRVQAIDDSLGSTLAYLSSENILSKKEKRESEKRKFRVSKKNLEYAKELGFIFAEKLKRIGKDFVVFDRNSKPYHGKVKEFCEAMRSSGINF
jgi:large subunit ribosomal protein L18